MVMYLETVILYLVHVTVTVRRLKEIRDIPSYEKYEKLQII